MPILAKVRSDLARSCQHGVIVNSVSHCFSIVLPGHGSSVIIHSYSFIHHLQTDESLRFCANVLQSNASLCLHHNRRTVSPWRASVRSCTSIIQNRDLFPQLLPILDIRLSHASIKLQSPQAASILKESQVSLSISRYLMKTVTQKQAI